ncbi:MAG: hypothetical protein JSU86_06715, partial [Phycisphaerales bacterium]
MIVAPLILTSLFLPLKHLLLPIQIGHSLPVEWAGRIVKNLPVALDPAVRQSGDALKRFHPSDNRADRRVIDLPEGQRTSEPEEQDLCDCV